MTKPKIYESPDKGETIYSRDIGCKERTLIHQSEKAKTLHEELMHSKMWGDIHRLSKTNPTLKDAVDKVIMVYELVKDRK
jgi:hypothetical protein